MAKDSRKEGFSLEAALVLLFGGISARGWLTTGPSSQELAIFAPIESRF